MPRRRLACSLSLLFALAAAAPVARAHFALRAPESWREQDAVGSPQKLGPCGDEGEAAATGTVTAFAPGETITITLDELIFHPGHYRVALAVNDRGELPAEPPVTPGDTACGSVPIMDPPIFPVLADGALVHATPFAGTQSFQVTLPADVSCTHCTLQVLEFMSNHGAPCFYHHCADISIGAGNAGCSSDDDCDDGDACTLDTCGATQTCASVPMTLEAAGAGFLGALETPACEGETPPAAIARGFEKATALLGRAVESPKASRLLRRAAKRLRRTDTKIAKASGRRLSPACGSALAAIVEAARTRVDCLRNGL